MTSELRRAAIPDKVEYFEEIDSYYRWQDSEGVKVTVEYAFDDLGGLELGAWERKGGKGTIINIPNPQLGNDAHVVEIDPGGKSEPEHHMYEENTYVISGRGATSVWIDENHKQTFEWQAGGLFHIPLNAWYQHFNGSGTEPARYISVTNAPPVMRLFHDHDFMFNNPFVFNSRFSADDDSFFNGQGTLFRGKSSHFTTRWQTNFVPNVDTMKVWDYPHRGAGGINTHFRFGGNESRGHVSEFPVGTYKKGHRHGAGAHLIILGGVGFSQLWWEGEERVRVDWKRGAMVIIPAAATFHQHFNTGTEPARYLVLSSTNEKGGKPGADLQIEYEEEGPEVHEQFEYELGRTGATCRMKAFVPGCTGVVGPTSERDT